MKRWVWPVLILGSLALGVASSAFAAPEFKVGDVAPNFELPGSDGKTYRLADYHGKQAVVLAWYPKAHTGGCTKECLSLSASGEKLKRYDVAYFGASTDAAETNRAWAESLKLTFPLLSDPGAKVARAYGVAGAMPIAARWTFFIGKDGRILAIDKDVQVESAGDDLIKHLDKLGIPKKEG